MRTQIPDVIDAYIQASNSRDADRFGSLFSEDAIVHDRNTAELWRSGNGSIAGRSFATFVRITTNHHRSRTNQDHPLDRS
jgi:hypothetical protein